MSTRQSRPIGSLGVRIARYRDAERNASYLSSYAFHGSIGRLTSTGRHFSCDGAPTASVLDSVGLEGESPMREFSDAHTSWYTLSVRKP